MKTAFVRGTLAASLLMLFGSTSGYAQLGWIEQTVHDGVKGATGVDVPKPSEIAQQHINAGKAVAETPVKINEAIGNIGQSAKQAGDASEKAGNAAERAGDAAKKLGDASKKVGDASQELLTNLNGGQEKIAAQVMFPLVILVWALVGLVCIVAAAKIYTLAMTVRSGAGRDRRQRRPRASADVKRAA